MHEKNLRLNKAYETQDKELSLDNLMIEGDIPKWLSGIFISNGPAKFEVGKLHFNHWFDGLAMLKKLEFQSGNVSFQNRFIDSTQYQKSNSVGYLNTNEFATFSKKSLLGRISNSFKEIMGNKSYDNCNINTTCINHRYIAMTESNTALEFDLNDLSTLGNFKFDDKIYGHLTTAHPHLDTNKEEIINVVIELGWVNKYHVYKTKPNSIQREIIKTYISDTLFYIHSFSVTPNYIILFKSPLVINKLKLLLRYPFNDTLSWQENSSSFFIIIDRRNGGVKEVETAAFVCLHSANAYEFSNELIIDLVCQENGNPYANLSLANLQAENPVLPTGTLKRYKIDLITKRLSTTILSKSNQEFPRLNSSVINDKNYNFLYTCCITNSEKKFLNGIQKLNVQNSETTVWQRNNYYPGEVVFIKKPNEKSEDGGILLSLGYDAKKQSSSFIILDARNMQQLAEVYLPFHLPLGLHGNFYSNKM